MFRKYLPILWNIVELLIIQSWTDHLTKKGWNVKYAVLLAFMSRQISTSFKTKLVHRTPGAPKNYSCITDNDEVQKCCPLMACYAVVQACLCI